MESENYGLVSIITPSYNSSAFIRQTIEGVLAQTYPHWELLITDDCSTDDSVEIIKGYCQQDARIKLFELEKNSGAGICRNNSIKNAQGRYIAFCDSDDVWMPQKLEKQLKFMKEKNCALAYSSYMITDENGVVNGILVCKGKADMNSMRRDNHIGCLTGIYDTEKVGKKYMPSIRKRQDWVLWLDILKQCGVGYGMKEPLAYYRVRTNSISKNKSGLIKHNINVYRQYFNYGVVKSYLCFFCLFLPSYFFKRFRIRLDSL